MTTFAPQCLPTTCTVTYSSVPWQHSQFIPKYSPSRHTDCFDGYHLLLFTLYGFKKCIFRSYCQRGFRWGLSNIMCAHCVCCKPSTGFITFPSFCILPTKSFQSSFNSPYCLHHRDPAVLAECNYLAPCVVWTGFPTSPGSQRDSNGNLLHAKSPDYNCKPSIWHLIMKLNQLMYSRPQCVNHSIKHFLPRNQWKISQHWFK